MTSKLAGVLIPLVVTSRGLAMKHWSGEHLAIEVSGPDETSEIVVRHPYALIGALARADVRLAGVQKREVFLQAACGKVICRRLEAALDTATRELRSDEWLQLGEFRLRARAVPAPDDSVGDASCLTEHDAKIRIPVLRVRRRGMPSVNRRLYAPLELVGRHADCEVELLCPKVSQYHCVLLRESNRLWCIDLGSGNGTFLNGQRIDCAQVELGDRLKVGSFELQFQRYSRSSASASSLGDNSASHIEQADVTAAQAEQREAAQSEGSTIAAGREPAEAWAGSQAAPFAEEFQRLEAERERIASLGEDLRRRLDVVAVENAQLRSDWNAQADQLLQRAEEQWKTLVQEVAQQTESMRKALSDELLLRQEELRNAETPKLAAQSEQQSQALSQELQQALEEQRTALTQELVLRTQEQLSVFAQEQQVRSNSLSERLESCLQALERLVSEQSRLSIGLTRHADQIQAIRQELVELRLHDHSQRAAGRSAPHDSSLPAVIDSPFESQVEPAEAPGEAEAGDIQVQSTGLSMVPWEQESTSLKREEVVESKGRPDTAAEDRLQHFVSDRLVEMDSGRQRRLIIYWVVAVSVAGLLCVLGWALRGWLQALT